MCISVIVKCHNFRFGYLFTCHTLSRVRETDKENGEIETERKGKKITENSIYQQTKIIFSLFFILYTSISYCLSLSLFHSFTYNVTFFILSLSLTLLLAFSLTFKHINSLKIICKMLTIPFNGK